LVTYSSEQEFVEDLRNFADIVFAYRGKNYFICPMRRDELHAGQAYQEATIFSTIEALLENFMVERRPLKEILLEIEIIAR